MKILIFSDIPPTSKYSGALVLEQIVRLLPRGTVSCFAVVSPELKVERPADMTWMPIHYIDKPDERSPRLVNPFGAFPDQRGALQGFFDRWIKGRAILKRAEAFGVLHQVDAVFAILQGQTIINLAQPLADRLRVPLYTLVWDPLVWWVEANKIDGFTAQVAYRSFDRAISASAGVAAASWAMAKDYERRYGARCIPVIRSHEVELARRPAPVLSEKGRLVIALAGQVYALAETQQLVKALNACGWCIRGREVALRFFGQGFPQMELPEGRLELMGWQAEHALVDALAACDLLYCPYPFDSDIEEVARLSFPSKLVTYLAAGRPSIVHGPEWASPAQYVVERGVGLCAAGRHASSIYNAIDMLVRDEALYQTCALNAQAAFLSDFTLSRMKSALYELFDLQPEAVEDTTPIAVEPVDERTGPRIGHRTTPGWSSRLRFDLSDPQTRRRAWLNVTTPLRARADLTRDWNVLKNPIDREPDRKRAEISTGRTPWDYTASLKLKFGRLPPRYLNALISPMQEVVYAFLVDESYGQVSARFRLDPRRAVTRVWFDLWESPTAFALVLQAGEVPRGTSVYVYDVSLLTPFTTWFGAGRAALRRAGGRALAAMKDRLRLVMGGVGVRLDPTEWRGGGVADVSETGAEVLTGAAPDEYIGNLPLNLPAGARHLRVTVRSTDETVVLLLVDKAYRGASHRRRIEPTQRPVQAWFDLSEGDDVGALVVQAGNTPRGGRVQLGDVITQAPWSARSARLS